MFEGMWPHALSNIEAGHSIIMELKYKNLHDKIKILEGGSKLKRGTSEQHDTPTTGQPRIINLTKKQLTKEQINILNLGPQYAMEINPKKCINSIIIETKVPLETWNPNGKTYTDSRQVHSSKGSQKNTNKNHYINTRKRS